jgi:hypothetical protein
MLNSGKQNSCFERQKKYAKYKLEPVEKLMEQPKSKEEWERIVKLHHNIYWHERCKGDQLEKKSLQYLQIQDRTISKPYNIWQSTGNDLISIKSGEIKSKLVTQSYMLQNIKSRYNNNISSICTLCETGDENIYHFLLVCSNLKSTRERHLQKIQEYLDSLRNGLYQDIQDADMLVQLLMDCTSQEINYGIRIKQKQCMEMERLRDRPFNLKEGGYGFLFRSEFFFRTTRELEYLFFCRARREFFFQNSTLGYMTKTLNQIIFFSSTKIRICFSATLGIRIFF